MLYDLRKKYSHIPGPNIDSFVFGSTKINNGEKSKILSFEDLFNQYGPLVVTWHVHKPTLSIQDQDIVQDAFDFSRLKDPITNGDLWELFDQRFLAKGAVLFSYISNSSFNDNCVIRHLKNINSQCELFTRMLQGLADGKSEIKMKELFDKLTIDVIGKVNQSV